MDIKWTPEDIELMDKAQIPPEMRSDISALMTVAEMVAERLSMAVPKGDKLRLETLWRACTGRQDRPVDWARERLLEVGLPVSRASGVALESFGAGLDPYLTPPKLFDDFVDMVGVDMPSTCVCWLVRNRVPEGAMQISKVEGGEE